eukprot:4574782-Prymnesium_polylepis.1
MWHACGNARAAASSAASSTVRRDPGEARGRGPEAAGPGGHGGRPSSAKTQEETRCTWTKNTIRHSCWSAL